MNGRTRQGGDSKVGCILWLLAMGLVAYVGLQFVPAQMQAAELKDFMTGQAEHSAEAPLERIRKNVLARIEQMELPLDKKALEVRRLGGRIRIEYTYSLPINLVFTTVDWSFEVKVNRPVIII